MSTHHELDARNLLCPMPVIRTQNLINKITIGDTLSVTCTDPGTMQDIPTWCRINGHHLEKAEQNGREFQFLIIKQ